MEVKKSRVQSRGAKGRAKASTNDILGNTSPEPQIDPKWKQQYQKLLDLSEQLRRQKGQLVHDALEEYTGPRRDPADVATNTFDRDWALGMATSDQKALYEIEEALNRIRAGTYGICQLTGQPISMDRLKAIPWTRFCAEAEQELESGGQLGRARLGERESLAREVEEGGGGDNTHDT